MIVEKPYCQIVCDGCEESLGMEEEGYFVLVERDNIEETLRQYDWQQRGERYFCQGCIDSGEADAPLA